MQQASLPVTAEALASLPSEAARKEFLGEHLYPRIEARRGRLASKITGMLLELFNIAILALLQVVIGEFDVLQSLFGDILSG